MRGIKHFPWIRVDFRIPEIIILMLEASQIKLWYELNDEMTLKDLKTVLRQTKGKRLSSEPINSLPLHSMKEANVKLLGKINALLTNINLPNGIA